MNVFFTNLMRRLKAIINFCNGNPVNSILNHETDWIEGAFDKFINKKVIDENGEKHIEHYKIIIDLTLGKVLNPVTHEGYGVAHIVDKHGVEVAKMIPRIILRGTGYFIGNTCRIKIRDGNYLLIVDKDKVRTDRYIVVTCYDKTKESEKSKTRREQRKNKK